MHQSLSNAERSKYSGKCKILDLPGKQKIGVKKNWVQESEIGEECRRFLGVTLGLNFLGGGLKPWRIKAEKLAENNSPSNFAEKFAGNFPKIRWTKIKNSPHIRFAEPQAQKFTSQNWNSNLIKLNVCKFDAIKAGELHLFGDWNRIPSHILWGSFWLGRTPIPSGWNSPNTTLSLFCLVRGPL